MLSGIETRLTFDIRPRLFWIHARWFDRFRLAAHASQNLRLGKGVKHVPKCKQLIPCFEGVRCLHAHQPLRPPPDPLFSRVHLALTAYM
jgi:hypothetical protein